MSNSTIVDLKSVVNEKDKKLQETSTDMLVDMFANQDKLRQDRPLWNYENRSDNYDNKGDDDSRMVDDNINDYEKKDTSKIFRKSDRSENNSNSTRGTDTRETDTRRSDDNNSRRDDDDDEDIKLKKLDLIRKLGELRDYGATISQNYNLDSDLKSMEYEYKLHTDIRSKRNAVTWMSHMMIGMVRGLEMLNDTYNPFEIKLSGLTTKVNNDLQAYYDVLGEIYEKYNKPGKKMAPELRLILMLSGAGLSLQLSKFMPNMLPNVSTELKNNENVINDLKDIANRTSSRHKRDLNNAVKKDMKAAEKHLSDMALLRKKELEIKKLRQENIDSLHEGLELSESLAASRHSRHSKQSRHSRRSKNNDSDSDEDSDGSGSGKKSMDSKDEKLMIENLAMRERIQELEREKQRKLAERKRDRARRKEVVDSKKLSGILNMMNRDIDNYSEMSSDSSISINPEGIDNILNKRIKKNKKRGKRKSKVKRNSSDSDLDSISIHDISVESSKNGKNKGSSVNIVTGK